MSTITTIVEVVFVWGAAVYLSLFYSGKLKYPEDKETKRKEILEKYGTLVIISIFLCIIGGTGILITSLL